MSGITRLLSIDLDITLVGVARLGSAKVDKTLDFKIETDAQRRQAGKQLREFAFIRDEDRRLQWTYQVQSQA